MQSTPSWNFQTTYTNLPSIFFTKHPPTPVRAPKLVIFNNNLAESLGVPLDLPTFAGNHIPNGAEPISQAYAGHQFGHFTMLGDGRATLIGEQITPSGERFDIQLKGSGKTPYSRGGDGRAALAPMLREYIISEAMHELGIPTTRSLAVVETGEAIRREQLLPGAVLTRVAASHIRVGTFEYAANFGTKEDLKALADYTITRHFPHIANAGNKYISLLQEVVKRQASLIAKWQLVGFIHGVMNTDNMAISGETIDYGPCAFVDTYHAETFFSSIDKRGRYAYKNQPEMAEWNIARFAESLLPLLHENQSKAIEAGEQELAKFWRLYDEKWLGGMRAKLGFFNEEAGDKLLVDELLRLMQEMELDYTNTFRALTLDVTANMEEFTMSALRNWSECYKSRLARQTESTAEIKTLMKAHNPAVIARNFYVEEALEAAERGVLSVMERFLAALKNPYEYRTEQDEYALVPMFCGYRTYCGT